MKKLLIVATIGIGLAFIRWPKDIEREQVAEAGIFTTSEEENDKLDIYTQRQDRLYVYIVTEKATGQRYMIARNVSYDGGISIIRMDK